MGFEPAASRVFAWGCVVCRCATTAAHKWILKSGTKRRTLKKIEWIKSFHSASLIQSKPQEHRLKRIWWKRKWKSFEVKSFFCKKAFLCIWIKSVVCVQAALRIMHRWSWNIPRWIFSGFLIRLALDYYISLLSVSLVPEAVLWVGIAWKRSRILS